MSYSTFNKHASSSSGGTLRELSQKKGWRESLAQWTKVGLFVGVALGSTLPAAALATSIISGVKFNDLNGNGVQDTGEKGLPAKIIYARNNTLANAGKGGDYTTYTNMEGRYRLTGLPAGNYKVWTGATETVGGQLEEFWQTAPIRAEEIGTFEQYFLDLPDNTELEVNFGLWDGIERQDCTLCVTANDQQIDVGEEVTVGGNVVDKAPDGSNLTITVEAFGYSAVKTVAAADRVADTSIPIELGVSFPKGGEYPVKVTVTSDNGAQAEGTGKIVVRDVATSDSCDVNVVNAWSTRDGYWDDPSVWSTGRVPSETDWVMISSGHLVKVPAITTQQLHKKEMLQVKGLCVAQGAKLGKFFYRKLATLPPFLSRYQKFFVSQRSGIRSISDCRFTGVTTNPKIAQNPCRWDDPNSWVPTGVPGVGANVYIPKGVSCVIPLATTTDAIKLNNVCNEGTLTTPAVSAPDRQQYWLSLNTGTFHNMGTVISSDGAAGGGPGVGIAIVARRNFQNDNIIRSGNGGYPSGNGGPIELAPANLDNTNTGKIITGAGAQGTDMWQGGTQGGPGGRLKIAGTGTCNLSGQVQTGNGGDTPHGPGGAGGENSINCQTLNLINPIIEGREGIRLDPIQIKLDANTRLTSKDISIVSDDNGKIEVGNLAEGAITAERSLTWAIGKGGIIDFSQVSDKAFKAGQEMIIYTDNLILPAGKTLAQLVDAPKVTVLPAKLLMNASWFTTEETMIGSPGEQLLLPLTLNNLGPAKDTYTLTVTNPQGWSMCNLPKTVTVNSQRNVKLECNVTLPATRGAENTVIITAASQTDPALQVTTTLHLQVAVEQYDLYGKVVDNNGQPVTGATVQVGEQTTTTEAQGQWMVMDLPVGEYNVTTSKEGYVFSSQTVMVNSQTTLMTISGNLQSSSAVDNDPTITPNKGPYSASGIIKDKLGPVAGVTVQIADQTATTDASGYWEITGLTAGNYIAEATKDGYLSFIQQFDVSEAMPTAKVPLKLASLLKLQVSIQPKVAKPGDDVTYLLSVTNNGDHAATGLILQDLIPEGTSLVSLTGENCDSATVTCSVSELAMGQTMKVKLVVNAPEVGILENTATVTANDYPSEVNVSTKEIVPPLSVLTTCTPNPVPMLESLHCSATVSLSATASETATGVKVITTLPTGVTLQAATPSVGTCDTSNLPTVTCQLNDLSNGHQATVEMDLTLVDAGLLVLTQETSVSANNYGTHSAKTRTNIFVPAEIQVDLALVIDITGSMQGEIDSAKAALKKFMATVDPNASPLMVLIAFKDEVTVKAFTEDMNVLLKAVDSLKAEGGGTCPEASVEAVGKAALHVKSGGQIWFSTDASPYPDADVQSVLDLLQSKNIRLHATVTGDCANSDSENGFAQAVNQ